MVRDYWFAALDPDVARVTTQALSRLRDAGVVLVESALPGLQALIDRCTQQIQNHDVRLRARARHPAPTPDLNAVVAPVSRTHCESEARYRSLTELATDWYWEQDESGHFTKVVGPVLEMLGIRVDDLAGNRGELMDGWDEAARGALHTLIAARQPFLDFVLRRVGADGPQQRFQVSGEPIFNRSCSYIGYRGIGVELTTKKIAPALSRLCCAALMRIRPATLRHSCPTAAT